MANGDCAKVEGRCVQRRRTVTAAAAAAAEKSSRGGWTHRRRSMVGQVVARCWSLRGRKVGSSPLRSPQPVAPLSVDLQATVSQCRRRWRGKGRRRLAPPPASQPLWSGCRARGEMRGGGRQRVGWMKCAPAPPPPPPPPPFAFGEAAGASKTRHAAAERTRHVVVFGSGMHAESEFVPDIPL